MRSPQARRHQGLVAGKLGSRTALAPPTHWTDVPCPTRIPQDGGSVKNSGWEVRVGATHLIGTTPQSHQDTASVDSRAVASDAKGVAPQGSTQMQCPDARSRRTRHLTALLWRTRRRGDRMGSQWHTCGWPRPGPRILVLEKRQDTLLRCCGSASMLWGSEQFSCYPGRSKSTWSGRLPGRQHPQRRDV